MISVVIPSHNAEKYIEKAVNSVLNQTYQDFEIIIVDDGSTDNTKGLVKTFKDSRIQYFYQENNGPSVARNRGVELAKGEYIAFLDADDIWHPEKLEIQLHILEKRPDICLLFSSIEMINEKTGIKFIKRFKNFKDKETLLKNLILIPMNIVPYPSTVVLRKEAIIKAGLFDPEIIVCEDWDLWLRMAYTGNFFSVNKVLTTAIKPDNSLSSASNLEKSFNNNLYALNKFFKTIDKEKKYQKYENKAYAMLFMNFGFLHFLAGNKKSTGTTKPTIISRFKEKLFNVFKNIIKFSLNLYMKLV